ncbi:aldo/keto reductase [Cystobacter ferrugineus]|uniref:Aldo/keto reductase n=1 Tax=Cystobacter ferrugineus TaxID=83449 RepID=A0A1L9AZ95_9BACT|nr:aldo/keto reductase [Cystobacter ferrugineus]OJH35322.1 aldo/keto reductase [Cystobacter ferrugineus]
MHYRRFGRTGWQVSEIALGAWQLGADWGSVTEDEALATVRAALDRGINFIDTADVYGDGRSEQLVARAVKAHGRERVYIATKAGRRLNPHVAEGYDAPHLTGFVERSLRNLGTDRIDLLQLHCPPSAVYSQDATFAALDELVRQGKLRHWGVSVETVEEARRALAHPHLASIQIIFNIFRQKPAETLFAETAARDVAVIARVPLASGLLTGKLRRDTRFAADDHRQYNRHGEAFDVGETFSGVPFETGLDAVEELRPLVPAGASMARFALRWILMQQAVSCVIPGARNPAQAEANAAAADLPPLSEQTLAAVRSVYDRRIRPLVHARW